MSIVTMSEARNNFFKLGEEVHKSHKPLKIKGKKFNMVMIDEEDWNSLQEMLYLASIPGMMKSIKEGLNSKPEDRVPYAFD
jgi:antitoxin YefM